MYVCVYGYGVYGVVCVCAWCVVYGRVFRSNLTSASKQKWYQISTSKEFSDIFERNVICDTAVYSLGSDSMITVNNTGIYKPGTPNAGQGDVNIGKAKVAAPGKLEVTFFGGVYAPYWITQLYENSAGEYTTAVVYSCQKVLGLLNQNVWVLSRTPQLLPEHPIDSLYQVAESQGIPISKIDMLPTPQNCGN